MEGYYRTNLHNKQLFHFYQILCSYQELAGYKDRHSVEKGQLHPQMVESVLYFVCIVESSLYPKHWLAFQLYSLIVTGISDIGVQIILLTAQHSNRNRFSFSTQRTMMKSCMLTNNGTISLFCRTNSCT